MDPNLRWSIYPSSKSKSLSLSYSSNRNFRISRKEKRKKIPRISRDKRSARFGRVHGMITCFSNDWGGRGGGVIVRTGVKTIRINNGQATCLCSRVHKANESFGGEEEGRDPSAPKGIIPRFIPHPLPEQRYSPRYYRSPSNFWPVFSKINTGQRRVTT